MKVFDSEGVEILATERAWQTDCQMHNIAGTWVFFMTVRGLYRFLYIEIINSRPGRQHFRRIQGRVLPESTRSIDFNFQNQYLYSMLKNTECRIGSLLKTHEGYVRVVSVGENIAMTAEPWPHPTEDRIPGLLFEGISLTQEWMESMGFDYSSVADADGNYYTNEWNLWPITVEFGIDSPIPPSVSIFGSATNINYIHQLQNLYFAVTGTELKIDGKLFQ